MCGCSANSIDAGKYSPSQSVVYTPAFRSLLAEINNPPVNFDSTGGFFDNEPAPIDANNFESVPMEEGKNYGIQPDEPWRTKYFAWYDLIHYWFVFGLPPRGGTVSEKSVNLHDVMRKTEAFNYQTALFYLDKLYENYKLATGDTFFINSWAKGKGTGQISFGQRGLQGAGLRPREKKNGEWAGLDQAANMSAKSNHFLGCAYDLHSQSQSAKGNNNILYEFCIANFAQLGNIRHIENRNHTSLPKDAAKGVTGSRRTLADLPGWVHVDWGVWKAAEAKLLASRPGKNMLVVMNANSSFSYAIPHNANLGTGGCVYWDDGTVMT